MGPVGHVYVCFCIVLLRRFLFCHSSSTYSRLKTLVSEVHEEGKPRNTDKFTSILGCILSSQNNVEGQLANYFRAWSVLCTNVEMTPL